MTVPLIQTEPCGVLFVGRQGFRERAAASTRALHGGVYCIAGDHVTVDQVASRLGVARITAERRLRREQRKPGPVTWAGLRA